MSWNYTSASSLYLHSHIMWSIYLLRTGLSHRTDVDFMDTFPATLMKKKIMKLFAYKNTRTYEELN